MMLAPFSAGISAAPSVAHLLSFVPPDVMQATRMDAPPVARAEAHHDALLTPSIDAFIRETMELWNLTGASIAIVRKRAGDSGEFDVSTRGYGVAARDGRAMTADTLLPIGSNSKAFSAAAVGLLVANESVSLDWTSKVHDVLPEFALQDEVATAQASIVDILSHRTGLPRHDWIVPSTFDEDDAPEDFPALKHLKMSAEFRDVTQYNNHMYDIGASLVAKVSGQPFKAFVRENIFEAAGFNATTHTPLAAAKQGILAEGFIRLGENLTYPGDLHALNTTPALEQTGAGSGSIASSANDIALWLQVLLNDGKSPKTGRQVVPTAVLRKMESGVTVYAPPAAPEFASSVYGMALKSTSYQGHQLIDHGGSVGGYLSQIVRFPNDGLGIAILTNDMPRGQYFFEAVRWRIAEELLGLPLRVDWNARYKAVNLALLLLEHAAEHARLPPPPDAPPPSADLVGTYAHPVYGTLELRHDSEGAAHFAATVDWAEGFLQSLHFAHYAGDIFNVTVTARLADGAEEHIPDVLAEFGVTDGAVQGLGLSAGGVLWGTGPDMQPPSGPTPRDRAEVWFERVGCGAVSCIATPVGLVVQA